MINNVLLSLFILLLRIPQVQAESPNISLTLDNAPVTQVLQALAEQQQRNVVMASDIHGTVSLHLDKVPADQVFALILKQAKLSAVKTGNILHIRKQESLAEETRQQADLRLQQQILKPVVHRVYTLRHADAETLGAVLQAGADRLLGPRNHITVDKRANRLLIRDNHQAQQYIAKWVADMDIPLQQIELAAHIVTINRDALHELGIRWSAASGGESGLLSTASAPRSLANYGSYAGLSLGQAGGRMLEVALSALEQQQQLDIIASPRLLVAHQQSATIKQGMEIPYQMTREGARTSSVAFKEAVLGMEVTPSVSVLGQIRLRLRISQNMPGRALQHAGGESLAIDKQEIETQVSIRDGETLVLGGIFQQHHRYDKRSVPFFGEIPWLGQLFRQQDNKHQRRELVVFITPKLLPAP